MIKRMVTAGAATVLVLAGVIGVARPFRTTAQQTGPADPMGQVMGQPLDQLSGDALDQAFLREMIMHHGMAVMMAQPVAANGQYQELKDLAQVIITDQTREIAQMRTWLRDWYGIDMPDPLDMMGMMGGMGQGGMMGGQGMPMSGGQGGMMGGQGMPMGEMGMGMMMDMMAQMWRLPPTRLEAMFMSMMIVHHEGAIDMSQLAPERAAHQEVKDLAATIISVQSTEMAQMNAWLAEWYGL